MQLEQASRYLQSISRTRLARGAREASGYLVSEEAPRLRKNCMDWAAQQMQSKVPRQITKMYGSRQPGLSRESNENAPIGG